MKTRSVILLSIDVLVLALLLLISSTDLVLKERIVNVHSISVIVPDENDDCWTNFKKGMERAAIEYNADISFITLYERQNAGQQYELLKREAENGAQALVVCPADCEALANGLNDSKITLPIVALHSRVAAPQVKAYVGADRSHMGKSLAETILKDAGSQNIRELTAVSVPGSRSDIAESLAALREALSGSGIPVRQIYAFSEEDVLGLAAELRQSSGQAVVALDPAAMQMLTNVMRSGYASGLLYGVGCSNRILRGLDEGGVRAVAVVDDYAAGYQSIKAASEILERTETGGEYILRDELIRPEMVYDKKYEMLLYPIF